MAQVHQRSPGKRSTVGVLLAASGACALAWMINTPGLAQGWGGGQRPGPGVGWDGAGRMGPNDQRFIVMMIPHHEGAIAMADLALNRAKRPEIRELAKRIKASQSQENAQMRTWYRQWYGSDVPTWSVASLSPGMGMGGGMGMGMGSMGMGMQMGMGMGMVQQRPTQMSSQMAYGAMMHEKAKHHHDSD